MSKIFALARNDLRLTTRDKASFMWMLAMPVAMMWFFGMMGGGGGDPKAKLTVIDRDGQWLAKAFIAQLAGPQLEVVEVSADRAGTTKQVRTLVIPEHFTAHVLAGRVQKLRVEKDQGADSEFSMAAEAHVIRAIAATLARLSEMKQTGALSQPQPGSAFTALAARAPLVQLEVSRAGHGQPIPTGRAQSVPGILTMTVLMMTVIYGGVFLTIEKRDGTLRRQMAGPVSRSQVFAGKVVGRLLVAGMQIVVLLLAGRFLFGVSFGHAPIALVVLLVAYAFSAAGLATLLGAVLKTPEQASAIGWLVAMVMAALGGCWWPSEVVPRWLWSAAHIFPTAWAMDAFHALISFGRGFEAVWLPALVLMGFGAGFSLLGARYLRVAAS